MKYTEYAILIKKNSTYDYCKKSSLLICYDCFGGGKEPTAGEETGMIIHLLIEDGEILDSMGRILTAIGFETEMAGCLHPLSLEPEELYLLDGETLNMLFCPNELIWGSTVLNLTEGTVRCGEKTVRLSPRECSLLALLMQSEGRCLSKRWILRRVWGMDTTATENNVEAYVGFLRRKLREIESDLSIETIRWQGYCMTNLKNP